MFIDVTSYRDVMAPPDEMLQNLMSLSPSEITRNLSRIYVYNINSAYRRRFRRILRVTGKNSNPAFHPGNLKYYLCGSLQELQTHFNLGSLQLPKETSMSPSIAAYSDQT